MNKKQKKALRRIIAAAALLLLILILPGFPGKGFLYLLPYLIAGSDVLKKAFKGILNLQPFDENFLMAVATAGAMALGEFTEGVAVMLFYQIGELFQSLAVGKSRKSIAELMDIRPDTAQVEREDGTVEAVDPDEVAVGSVICVGPGERIPIDGRILSGISSLNTSALTGESRPRSAAPGDRVQSGAINLSGLLRIETDREFGESTASRILELVENAASLKSRSENFITGFARIYTPAVCFGALALFLLPPLFSLLGGGEALWGRWLYRALTFLVISCPCALVISIPLTFFASLGGASREGVLIKGSNYMETLSKARIMVFDKTGTLTEGVFEVTEIVPSPAAEACCAEDPGCVSKAGTADASECAPEDRLLDLAAHAECASSHPIAQSLVRALGKEPDRSRIGEVKEMSGHGVIAMVDGRKVAVGNAMLMEQLNVTFEPQDTTATVVYVAENGRYAGHIRISDRIKSGAADALKALKMQGIRQTVMLSGDSQAATEEAARAIGLDRCQGDLLPEDKVRVVEELLASAGRGEKLAFAGDGINDAPVLSRADVGIAMGALGADAAIEAADVVLMDDDPGKIAVAVAIARKCMRIVYENIAFAIGIKVLCLILGALGLTGMWAAIFADVGVMVLAVLNAVRALRRGK